MRYLEIFVNADRQVKTTDISKIVPFDLIDSIEDTVLDLDIQKNGGAFELDIPVEDSYGRIINRVFLPPIKAMIEENCWILDDIQMRFNTVMKVHRDYREELCKKSRLQNCVRSYIDRGLADGLWGKEGAFMKICMSHRCPDSFRAVALPNADYAINEIGIPKAVMLVSERKHGDFALITRFPAIWSGSIEAMRCRASSNDCIEIHPLLHKQFNLDHDGDTLSGYWVPDEPDCIQEAEEKELEFFKQQIGSWPKELCMNGQEKCEYDTEDLDKLKAEAKQRLVPDGLSIDPVSLLNQEHDLDELTGKEYREDISAICRGIGFENFYERSIDINIKNLTMKMFLGPVGSVSNEVKLVGVRGPKHVRESAMYISEALQQSLMDSKHEVGSANNMRFMKVKDAIRGVGPSKTNVSKILECIAENGLDAYECAPFVIYMYVFKPLEAALVQVCKTSDVSDETRKNVAQYYMTLLNQRIDHKEYSKMFKAFTRKVSEETNCSRTVFKEVFKKKMKSLTEYVNCYFPVYRLTNKSSAFNDGQNINELFTRVIVNNENDIYGSCAKEFSKFGD